MSTNIDQKYQVKSRHIYETIKKYLKINQIKIQNTLTHSL